MKLAFNMTRLMEVLKIYLGKQLLIKYYAIKHLILLKILNMMDLKEVLLQRFIFFLLKRLLVVVLKMNICQKNINSSFIDNIWSADLADMQLISNYNKGIHFCYVLWTFAVNMHGFFL